MTTRTTRSRATYARRLIARQSNFLISIPHKSGNTKEREKEGQRWITVKQQERYVNHRAEQNRALHGSGKKSLGTYWSATALVLARVTRAGIKKISRNRGGKSVFLAWLSDAFPELPRKKCYDHFDIHHTCGRKFVEFGRRSFATIVSSDTN